MTIFEKKPLSIFVNISIALTLVVAMGIKYSVTSDTKNYMLSFFRTVHEPRSFEPVITDLAAASIGLSETQLKALAEKTRASYAPYENQNIFSGLLRYKNNKAANKLGVYLMESTGHFYQNEYFIFYVGVFFGQGKYVDKDLNKSKSALSDVLLKDNKSAQFQLGLLYLDSSFSDHDPAKARILIQRAADGGLVAAQQELLKLPAP
jgi:TPR repeat protein